MEPASWILAALAASFVAAVLRWARGQRSGYRTSYGERRFPADNVDQLLALEARRPRRSGG